ncbi:Hsp70 family protein [Streptomyces sp. MUM 16J]|uniref:Hsp70 family protein n=1 Tax=Streptomyces sp. MUM 16J TaxID=2791988 RepID=UPI001F037E2C|nr:Hsp70 family protein [Streptomyces sp. MUM 16J]MCH0561226.1 Hsp70 family protein [Streptomyces sp. MUM 16J]
MVDEGTSGNASWKLHRALKRVESRFRPTVLVGRDADRAATAYGRALVLALDENPALARNLFDQYDARLPAEQYASGFGAAETAELHLFAGRVDRTALTVVIDVAGRLGDHPLRRRACCTLAGLLGADRDAESLVSWLRGLHQTGALDVTVVTAALEIHTAQIALGRDATLWSAFFDHLPHPLVPDRFDVRLFLGRGADAVRLADTPARKRDVLAYCVQSSRLVDVQAGLDLADAEGDTESARRLSERAGDLTLAEGRPGDALPYYERAGLRDRMSWCHEQLGDFRAALDTCPGNERERLAHLAGACRAEIDALVEQGEHSEAVRRIRALLSRLDGVEQSGPVARRRDEVEGLRQAVLAVERRRLQALFHSAPDDGSRRSVHEEWGRFEEEAGELLQAARHAEDAEEHYRAHRLYQAVERFGDAERVLHNDDSPEGLAARAAAREAGGDLLGAARLHEQADRYAEAVVLYERADDQVAGARCLIRWRGDEAIEDPRLAGFLRRAGDLDELVRLCVDALATRGSASRAAAVLRSLVDADETSVTGHLRQQALEALESAGAFGRGVFEERAGQWAAQAKEEVGARFSSIWGMDLGTSTCVAAVYDTKTERPVVCPHGGKPYFASTLSVTDGGEELVGLTGDAMLAPSIATISAAKRRMGDNHQFRIRDRRYRPEEVAARMIGHARTLVESFLSKQVKERIADLARAELGEIRDEWLDWAAEQHDLVVNRPRAIVTIPAYFRNNAKSATRSACEIAGVDLVRLIHEPTAACMAVARQRRLEGQVAVLDLGAGTLDASFLEVEYDVYEVKQVAGDDQYGGRDFDAAITDFLADRLRDEGLDVPTSGRARQRLRIAAEYLKIALSSRREADYTLNAFLDQPSVRVELTQTDLAGLLAEPLGTLRRVCEKARDEWTMDANEPQHLVLVGGPMLSPLVSGVVEDVFGLKRTGFPDPRASVACGAALQGAVLAGDLRDILLQDVTPLPLGIRVRDRKTGDPGFSIIIQAYTWIPTQRSEIYTTVRDNQDSVLIEIYNGQLDARSKIGQFELKGIPPLPAGRPQIEVTFSFDTSCVLDVTAVDLDTGQSNSARITDPTLLSPREIREMTERRVAQKELEKVRRVLRDLVDEAAELDSEQLCREFRDRLEAHRPTRQPLDQNSQRLLSEMYGNEATDVETELHSLRGPLRDLTVTVRDYLSHPAAMDRADAGRHLAERLAEHLDRLRQGMARVAGWNRVLAALAVADTDPLRRFRALHDAGDHQRALCAHDELTEPLTDPEDLRRRLRCLAGIGDLTRYQATLLADAQRLPAIVLDRDDPERFLDAARPALVRVSDADGRERTGFLISDRHVLTGGCPLTAPTSDLTVHMTTGTRAVRHVFRPDSSAVDACVILLAERARAQPLRLGFPRLTNIGDEAWAAASDQMLVAGILQGFESFPEYDLKLFRTDLELPPTAGGGPLLNELGEVIGMLVQRGSGATTFAISVDSFASLLASAGFGLSEPRGEKTP